MDGEMTNSSKAQQGRRAFARISRGDITRLCELQEISAQITTGDTTLSGALVDVSEGGMSVELPVPLDLGLSIEILFTMGERRISCKALVKQIRLADGLFIVGVQFTEISKRDALYIDGIVHIQTLLYQLNTSEGIPQIQANAASTLCEELRLISTVFLAEPYQGVLSRGWCKACK